MRIPDLSSFNPGSEEHRVHNTVAIGWLSSTNQFAKQEPSGDLIGHLVRFCKVKFVPTRGYHECELCQDPLDGPVPMEEGGGLIWLGSAEIRVIGNAKIYAAPDLVYHYVVAHSYKPPDEFTDAVLTGPQPTSPEFQKLLSWYQERQLA